MPGHNHTAQAGRPGVKDFFILFHDFSWFEVFLQACCPNCCKGACCGWRLWSGARRTHSLHLLALEFWHWAWGCRLPCGSRASGQGSQQGEGLGVIFRMYWSWKYWWSPEFFFSKNIGLFVNNITRTPTVRLMVFKKRFHTVAFGDDWSSRQERVAQMWVTCLLQLYFVSLKAIENNFCEMMIFYFWLRPVYLQISQP